MGKRTFVVQQAEIPSGGVLAVEVEGRRLSAYWTARRSTRPLVRVADPPQPGLYRSTAQSSKTRNLGLPGRNTTGLKGGRREANPGTGVDGRRVPGAGICPRRFRGLEQ
jgi:hypothetical protein